MEKEMSFQEMPVNREMDLMLGARNVTVFMGKGFFDFSASPSPYHHHHYAEVHLLAEGAGTYVFSGGVQHLHPCELLLIPAGQFHEATGFSAGTRHIAMQMSCAVPAVKKIAYPREKTEILFDAIRKYCREGKSGGLSGALMLLLSEFLEEEDAARPIRDTDFLIDDYFDHCYQRDPRLEELARILNLSAKQTARLVLRCTGHTFREEITRRRMEAARQMMKDQSLSLTQIAEKVGYQSYSGFWKAFREQKTPGTEKA